MFPRMGDEQVDQPFARAPPAPQPPTVMAVVHEGMITNSPEVIRYSE